MTVRRPLPSRVDAALAARRLPTHAAVFLVALAPRVLFLLASARVAGLGSAVPGLDVALNWSAASHLRAGTPAPVFELMAQSAPLYPWALALAQRVFGEHLFLLKLGTAVLGAARFPLAYEACLVAGARPCAGLAAVLLAAWAPAPIWADATLLKASLDLTLVVVFVWASLVLLRGLCSPIQSAVWACTVGAFAVLAALSQLNTLLYGIAPLVALVAARWPVRRRLLAALCIALPLCSGVALWSVRTQASTSEWLGRTGFELYLGNRPEATGYYTPVPEVPAYPFGHAFVARIALEREFGRSLTPQAADDVYRRRATAFWTQEPALAARLALKKVLLFFNAFEPRDSHYLAWVVASVPWMPPASSGFALFALLGLAGLAFPPRTLAPGARCLLVGTLLAVLAANVATYVNFRFRLPALVPLCIAGALFLTRLFDSSLRDPKLKQMLLGGALLALVVFAPIRPERVEAESMNKARSNAALSRVGEAEAAKLADEAKHGPMTALLRVQLLLHLQRYTDAHRTLHALYLSGHRQPWLVQGLARYLLWANDLTFLRRLFAETSATAWRRPLGELTQVEFQRLLQLRADAAH